VRSEWLATAAVDNVSIISNSFVDIRRYAYETWRESSYYSTSQHYMDIRDERFALAAIIPGKEPLAPLNRILCPGIFHYVVVR
jgi:hypothetical protein